MQRASVAVAIVFSGVLLAHRVPTAQNEFANVKELGRAVREYKNDAFHVVVAYNYSQLKHDSRWIVVQLAVASRRPMTIRRADIFIYTPDLRVIDLASLRRFREDAARVSLLLQNAAQVAHPVD